jgi:hypothetical protein
MSCSGACHVVHRAPTLRPGCAGRLRLSPSGRRRHQDHQGRVRCPAEDRRHRRQGPTDTRVVELLDHPGREWAQHDGNAQHGVTFIDHRPVRRAATPASLVWIPPRRPRTTRMARVAPARARGRPLLIPRPPFHVLVCHSSNPVPGCPQIKFDTTMKDLKKRKCNAVFGSRAYKDMKRKLDNKDKECEQLDGSHSPPRLSCSPASCVTLKKNLGPVTPLARRPREAGQEGPVRRRLRRQGNK